MGASLQHEGPATGLEDPRLLAALEDPRLLAALRAARPRDAGGAEEASDEDEEHLASTEAVPRSDAGALTDLQALGITPEQGEPGHHRLLDHPVVAERSLDDLLRSLRPSRLPGAQLPGEWRVVPLEGGVHFLLNRRRLLQGAIRESRCHIELDTDADVALLFAPTRRARRSAMELLGQARLPQQHLSAPEELADTGVDPDMPELLRIAQDLHVASGFEHRTFRPDSMPRTREAEFRPRLDAIRFGHPLDGIQQRAIACVERAESVLVCAPTSAGKTVVATYAVAMALRAQRRVIYTTPVKALSNQKFRELVDVCGADCVGLLTGDVSIQSDAPATVMTLEILLSMLYKQAQDPQLLDDFAWVVIDEAHYLGNEERGYAWEEALVLLPQHLRLVLLSATVPNADSLATWIARIRIEPVHVLRSDRRPVPLRHQIFRCGPPMFEGRRRSFFEVFARGRNGRFLRANVAEAVRQRRQLVARPGAAWRCPQQLVGRFIGRQGQHLRQIQEMFGVGVKIVNGNEIRMHADNPARRAEAQDYIFDWLLRHGVQEDWARPPAYVDPHALAAEDLERLLSLLQYRRHLPAIGFCFDRRMCERVALLLAGAKRMDFAFRPEHKEAIRAVVWQGMQKLTDEDRALQQVASCAELLLRGVGVHHGGMLPILRELVEMLFKDGLLPIVFATETFAIGLNMPAKAVIFIDVLKFDGTCRRVINPGEFLQMSGRAGRRGTDSMGFVYTVLRDVVMMEQPAEEVLEKLFTQDPPPVRSQYRLKWSSLLHLVCTGPAHLHQMLRRTFLAHTDPGAASALSERCAKMVLVLQSLDYIDSHGVALQKGSIACRLFVPEDALLVTEILMAGRGFRSLSAPQIFAVCASLVAAGPADQTVRISDPEVKVWVDLCAHIARNLAAELHRHGLPCTPRCTITDCDGEPFARAHVKLNMVETARLWAEGEDFTTAVLRSGVNVGGEGNVVNNLRRLDELVREVTFILRHRLGALQLADELQRTRQTIRRGVLAAESLYLGEAEDVADREIEPDVAWPEPALAVGEVGEMDPLEICFSQRTCGAQFRRVVREPDILSLAVDLCFGRVRPEDVETLEVFWFRHRFYVLGNRRLAAFRLWRLFLDRPVLVPVRAVGRERATQQGWQDKFSTGFTGGRKIRIGGTCKYVGVTREQSTFGAALWSGAGGVPGSGRDLRRLPAAAHGDTESEGGDSSLLETPLRDALGVPWQLVQPAPDARWQG